MSVRPGKKKEGKTVFDMRVQCSSIRVSRTVPTTLLSINHPGKFFENKGLTEITLQDRSYRLSIHEAADSQACDYKQRTYLFAYNGLMLP